MVERSGPGRTPWWYLVGAVAGGATTGVGLGLLGLALPAAPVGWALAVLGAAAALLLVHDARWHRWPLPQNPRQVRQSVLREHPTVGAVMFGFEMGTGARTPLTGAAPYLAVLAVAVAGGWWAGLLCGLGFGLGRGLLPLDREWSGDRAGWDVRLRRRTARAVPLSTLAAAVVIAAVAVTG